MVRDLGEREGLQCEGEMLNNFLVTELSTSLKAEKTYSQCNSQTLKEVADLLCQLVSAS